MGYMPMFFLNNYRNDSDKHLGARSCALAPPTAVGEKRKALARGTPTLRRPSDLRLRRCAQEVQVRRVLFHSASLSPLSTRLSRWNQAEQSANIRKVRRRRRTELFPNHPLHGPPRGSCLSITRAVLGGIFDIGVVVLSQNGPDAKPIRHDLREK